MLGELPERVEPLQLADQGSILEGSLPLGSFERLRDLAPPGGMLRAQLKFDLDSGRRPLLSGSFSTTLMLDCQRCMEAMPVALAGEFSVFLVRDLDEADRLSDRMDVLQVGDRAMSLRTILEDEVLLAVPPAPLHPREQCSAAVVPPQQEEPPQEQQRPNPFAALAALKQNSDPDDR